MRNQGIDHSGIVGTGEEYKGPTIMYDLGSGRWDHSVDTGLENPTAKYREGIPDVANSVSGNGLVTRMDENTLRRQTRTTPHPSPITS